jgi:hypothetical protein
MKTKSIFIFLLIFILFACQTENDNFSDLKKLTTNLKVTDIENLHKNAPVLFTNLREESFLPFSYQDTTTLPGELEDISDEDGFTFTTSNGSTNVLFNKNNIGYFEWNYIAYTSGKLKTHLMGYNTKDTKTLLIYDASCLKMFTFLKNSNTIKEIPVYKIGIDYSANIKILENNILIIKTWDFVRRGQYEAYILIDVVTGEYLNFPIKGSSSKSEYVPNFN